MTISNWNKFLLLMWKSWLLQKRNKLRTSLEILSPIVYSACLVLIRSLVNPVNNAETTLYPPVSINQLTPLRSILTNSSSERYGLVNDWRILYTPNSSVYKELVDESSRFLGLEIGVGVNSSEELATTLATERFLVGLMFHQDNVTELPNHLKYSIRFPSELRTKSKSYINNWATHLLYPLYRAHQPRNPTDDDGGLPPGYAREGFLTIQNAIADQYLRIKSNGTAMPDIELQRFPYPPHVRDKLLIGLQTIVSLMFLLSFQYPFTSAVKYITVEKEKQLKEWMKIMGLPNWLHWTSWFLRTMILFCISISLMVFMLKVSWYKNTNATIFTYSDWSCLWVFLFVYSLATTTLSFMFSVFFSNANTAASISGLIWFMYYTGFTLTVSTYNTMTLFQKMILSLLPNTGMAFGFQIIIRLEATTEGLQWNNVWKPLSVDDSLSMGAVMNMLLVASFFQLLIALYTEKLLPGEFGVPEPWYFPFTKSFWCGKSESENRNQYRIDYSIRSRNAQYFEDDPQDRHCGVKVINLRKVYAQDKIAVQGLNLNMFEDQILVLLGHNGAGKTSTMSMLTGMMTPTSGTAIINGKDICRDIDGARSSLGLCPQHNILFDELTVREHIIFFSKLKGLDANEVDGEVEKYVKLIGLEPKMNAMSKTLSGGMKRKLCVCIALCGGSKVVLLDEPTSGMDPASRRALWEVLREQKLGRTILLSTHFMDEADVLGDRIAIMSNGELKSVGSTFFLKKKFGTGYHLTCVKKSSCITENITRLLQCYVPDAMIASDVGSELSYQLPDADSKGFKRMFEELENKSEELGVESYGISLTTMEDVFLKVGIDVKTALKPAETNGNGDNENGLNLRHNYAEEIPLYTGIILLKSQIMALFKKKVVQSIRNWLLLLIQLFIPAMMISVTVLSQRAIGWFSDLPKLTIRLKSYLNSVTVVEASTDVNETSLVQRFVSEYSNQVVLNEGHKIEHISESFQTYILRMSKDSLLTVNAEYLIGATMRTADRITAWFNNQAFHTAPLSVSLVHNAVLQAHLGADHQITVCNEPLPYSAEARAEFIQVGGTMGFQMAVNVGFAMAFVASFYVLPYIKERKIRSKLLQFVSGANIITFWLTAYLWDFLTFVATVLVLVITFGIFQEDGWSSPAELSRILLVLIVFIFSILPVTFIASRFFKEPADGFGIMSLFYIITGMACFFMVFIMRYKDFELDDWATALNWIFLIFPHFAVSDALSNLSTVTAFKQICDTQCKLLPGCTDEVMCKMMAFYNITAPCCTNDYFDFENNGIGRHLLYMGIVGILALAIHIFMEDGLFASIFYGIKNSFTSIQPTESSELQDSDVLEEKERVKAMTKSEIEKHNLVVSGISKFYGNFVAVNDMSVAVVSSECFGLLGVNGAGKTSTFKMFAGDSKISKGDGWIRGLSLKYQQNKIHKRIGYCPQFDALLGNMTGRETLEMYCMLRGVPNERIEAISMQLATDLDFLKHIDKMVKDYSGGNKRKLSAAVALIGNPIVVYFDEPTSGMDPGSRRQFWDMAAKIRKTGKSIILTSHSMDECEALCTRLAIMVNGEFKCLGSVQHLKNKFSQAYSLTIKVRKSYSPENDEYTSQHHNLYTTSFMSGSTKTGIKNFVSGNFVGASLKEEYDELLTYFIPKSSMKWSTMFGLMEEAKSKYNIEDYSLSQASLEQVFLWFANQQREEKKSQ